MDQTVEDPTLSMGVAVIGLDGEGLRLARALNRTEASVDDRTRGVTGAEATG